MQYRQYAPPGFIGPPRKWSQWEYIVDLPDFACCLTYEEARLEALNQPGFDFHPLRGSRPRRYSIHVNGPWCITFEWRNGRALRVDLEQYH